MLNEWNQIHNFIFSSGSGTVINYGSGSDFLTSYGSGSGSTSQKVTVATVPVPVPQHWLWIHIELFCFHNVCSNVADPDPNPYVFGPRGSGSGSIGERCGSGSGSFYEQSKIVIKPRFLLLCDFFFTFYPWKMIEMYLQGFSNFFCLLIEGFTGSTPLSDGSGSGRPKNMWIRWIQIRIRNTDFLLYFFLLLLQLFLLLKTWIFF